MEQKATTQLKLISFSAPMGTSSVEKEASPNPDNVGNSNQWSPSVNDQSYCWAKKDVCMGRGWGGWNSGEGSGLNKQMSIVVIVVTTIVNTSSITLYDMIVEDDVDS